MAQASELTRPVLDRETLWEFLGYLTRMKDSGLQLSVAGALIPLRTWRNKGYYNIQTLDFLIQELEQDQGPSERNLGGMISFTDELLSKAQ